MTFVLISISVLVGVAGGFFFARSKGSSDRKRLLEQLKNVISGSQPSTEAANEDTKEIVDLIKTRLEEPKKVESEKKESVDSGIKERLNNTLIINELGQRITSSLKLEETFDHLYHTLNSMMDASVLELGVFDTEMEQWQVFSNKSEPHVGAYYNHFAEWTLKNNRIVFLNDVELDYGRFVNEPLTLQSGEPAQSLMSFPISIDNEVKGTISIISQRKNAFDEYHEESIKHLLNFLAVALQNAFTHEQLNLLKIRAEESEKHEQQFLANMSHEIRTPMNAVLGMTNLLLDTSLNEKQIKYLQAINTSSKNLLVIIN
ncbi:MAG: histidine kinase dimerization/phospho-acceptor domain-containing protein, partial [Bacteroidota bacterium]